MAIAVSAHTAQQDASACLRDCLAEGSLDLPLLSRTASEVIALCGSDNSDARTLAQLIQQDPALAAEVLRIANCASFSSGNAIVSLQQAIARMGLERVREVALAIALKSDLFKTRKYEGRLKMAWARAIASAAWSREVARACRVNAEMVYLSGLLHNVGIPVLLRIIERLDLHMDDLTLEAALHELSALAGSTLIRRWSLPEQVATVIEQHTDADSEDQNVRIVSAAIWLSELADDASTEALQGARQLQRVNLYPEDVARLWRGREKVRQMIEALAL